MASGFPMMGGSIVGLVTSKTIPMVGGSISHMRAPSDPYYYANVDIINMVIGSRWFLGYDNGGTFTELASGEAVSSEFTIPNVPSYAAPMLLELRVRKSSAAPKYRPLRVYALHSSIGIAMYVSQVFDGVAT